MAGFWLLVWQVLALVVGERLLLPSPLEVAQRLSELVVQAGFWATVAHTLARIAGGFLAGMLTGALAAAGAARWRLVDALVTPLVGAVRAAPVVSFIILVLIWVDAAWLALVVSALMVLPVAYADVLAGFRAREGALLEVAHVFRLPWTRRVTAIDLPALLPFLAAACRVGIGLAWKSGVAAEVIGLPAGSVGERLYDAKLLLESADVFAWTLVIVALSSLMERGVVLALRRAPGATPAAVAP